MGLLPPSAHPKHNPPTLLPAAKDLKHIVRIWVSDSQRRPSSWRVTCRFVRECLERSEEDIEDSTFLPRELSDSTCWVCSKAAALTFPEGFFKVMFLGMPISVYGSVLLPLTFPLSTNSERTCLRTSRWNSEYSDLTVRSRGRYC